MLILVDGENFRHQIAHVLYGHKKVTDRNNYFKFDLVGFFREVVMGEPIQIQYYTTRIKQPTQEVPLKLQRNIDAISEANRRWIADLANQKITVIKAGYLRVRESNSCMYCGKKTMILQEKGVDVRVATDLVLAAKRSGKQPIVLGSSDSDLIPALSVARKSGLKVTYLCYAGWLNRSIAAQADKTITYDDGLVLKYYRGSK